MPFPVVDAFETESNHCFENSRRLTGHNRFVAGPAAILDAAGPLAREATAHARWQALAQGVCASLGWIATAPTTAPNNMPMVATHAHGAELIIPAPTDALFTATEINEWAWEVACGKSSDVAGADAGCTRLHPIGDRVDEAAAFFAARCALEREPALMALRDAAVARGLAFILDDDVVSIGMGAGCVEYTLRAVPKVDAVPWASRHDVPLALVTGSNGKTTTVRLIAAMLAAANEKWAGRVGVSSTAGVALGGEFIAHGDYSGPAGARRVLRDKRVEAAVLETARGGMLRRGLAVGRADVAVVTNISADHFGEYGVNSLDDLADAKLTVARALDEEGTLVLNADDPRLLARAAPQYCRVALFSFDDEHAALRRQRATGEASCGVADGVLWLTHDGMRTPLGNIADLPLTVGGAARYNIANLAAASLAAAALGVGHAVIANVAAHFGNARVDNPGRLERWALADVTVLIDYAHNPDGLTRLLEVGRTLVKGDGRLLLLLGQAGNRDNDAIAELAQVAAAANPAFIVIKELPDMLRGRQLGEVPALIEAALCEARFSRARIAFDANEVDAVRRLLRDARAADVVVLPVHQTAARDEVVSLMDELERIKWRTGQALPGRGAQ